MGRGRARLSTFHNNDLQRKELTEVSCPHTLPVGTAPACQTPSLGKRSDVGASSGRCHDLLSCTSGNVIVSLRA